jgi:hypothetical protein
MLCSLRLLVLGGAVCAVPFLSFAQSSYDLYGSARADALGYSVTADPAAGSVHANPAAAATRSRPTAHFYARQSFGLSALRYGATSVILPFEWGVPSAGASTFGFDEYREVHLSAGYARSVSFGTTRSIHLGTTVRYHHTSIAGFGSSGAVGLNVGFLLALLRSLHLGAHATNVNGAHLATNEPLPRTLALGLHYRPLDHVSVLADVFKDVRFPLSVRGGIEIRPVAPLVLRTGITTAPVRFMGGAGVRLGPLQASIAAEQHQELGWSPSASLRVHW